MGISQDNPSGRLAQHIHFPGHDTFCSSRHPIDLDAMVASLTLEEGE
jgi:hypothetical protein